MPTTLRLKHLFVSTDEEPVFGIPGPVSVFIAANLMAFATKSVWSHNVSEPFRPFHIRRTIPLSTIAQKLEEKVSNKTLILRRHQFATPAPGFSAEMVELEKEMKSLMMIRESVANNIHCFVARGTAFINLHTLMTDVDSVAAIFEERRIVIGATKNKLDVQNIMTRLVENPAALRFIFQTIGDQICEFMDVVPDFAKDHYPGMAHLSIENIIVGLTVSPKTRQVEIADMYLRIPDIGTELDVHLPDISVDLNDPAATLELLAAYRRTVASKIEVRMKYETPETYVKQPAPSADIDEETVQYTSLNDAMRDNRTALGNILAPADAVGPKPNEDYALPESIMQGKTRREILFRENQESLFILSCKAVFFCLFPGDMDEVKNWPEVLNAIDHVLYIFERIDMQQRNSSMEQSDVREIGIAIATKLFRNCFRMEHVSSSDLDTAAKKYAIHLSELYYSRALETRAWVQYVCKQTTFLKE